MNEKRNKIIEWGIAIAIIAILATIVLPNFISMMQTSGISVYYILLSSLFSILPIIVFLLLHYFILRKTLNEQYPFQQLRKYPHINPNSLRAPFNAYMVPFSLILMIFPLMQLGTYFNLKEIMSLLGPLVIPILLLATITTTTFLVFSNFYFAKPIKETWKAILLAGIIAGASSFALSYGLWKIVGPYLPVRTNNVQSTTE